LHDIWNPWHGCTKCSEGCENCYMYYLDKTRNQTNSANCVRTSSFDYPLKRDRNGNFKIKSGELIRVCMTSDFFLNAADAWRNEAWDIMYQRPDVKFFLLTKRPERVRECLPRDWGEGWDNIFFNVTCENQKRADERIPLLLDLPFKHKGIMTAPLISEIQISDYLKTGQIEQVICGGENYDGCRPCHYEWVESLYDQCVTENITFAFIETGTNFFKGGKQYRINSKSKQTIQAYKSGLQFQGKPIEFELKYPIGITVPTEDLYVPHFAGNCKQCGSRLICNGCSDCGKCQ